MRRRNNNNESAQRLSLETFRLMKFSTYRKLLMLMVIIIMVNANGYHYNG